jgi:hypothetical protein
MLARFSYRYECESRVAVLDTPVEALSQAEVVRVLATLIDPLCPCELDELVVEGWSVSLGRVDFRVWDKSIGHPIKDFIVGSVEALPADER